MSAAKRMTKKLMKKTTQKVKAPPQTVEKSDLLNKQNKKRNQGLDDKNQGHQLLGKIKQ